MPVYSTASLLSSLLFIAANSEAVQNGKISCLFVCHVLVGVCRYTYWSNTQGNHRKETGNQKCGISSFSTTQLYLSTNPSSYKIHTLFSLHFSQVVLLFQHQTNVAHNHPQSVEIMVNKVRCFKTPALSSCYTIMY